MADDSEPGVWLVGEGDTLFADVFGLLRRFGAEYI